MPDSTVIAPGLSDRPRLSCQLRACRRRNAEATGFAWQDYGNLITAAHRGLPAPLVWCWNNLSTHLAPELADFAAQNTTQAAGLPADRRLPGRDRPDNRTLLTTCTTSSTWLS
jgi:hypothetical protein